MLSSQEYTHARGFTTDTSNKGKESCDHLKWTNKGKEYNYDNNVMIYTTDCSTILLVFEYLQTASTYSGACKKHRAIKIIKLG